MQISKEVRNVLEKNSIKIPDDDYNGNDMLIIYEKIILFLNKKMSDILLEALKEEDTAENEIDYTNNHNIVLDNIQTLLPSQLCDVYSKQFFVEHTKGINYQTATLLCENAVKFNYNIEQLWKDVHINGGKFNSEGV